MRARLRPSFAILAGLLLVLLPLADAGPAVK
jgi:hypothetical protein